MSNLIDHADKELKRIGAYENEGLYDGAIGPAVMDLIKVFSEQGHSGMSAGLVRSLFNKLADFKPIQALTGEDSEWNEVGENNFQNNRCSHVFKGTNGAYDINGIIFRDQHGCTFTGEYSRVPVTFPYTPVSITVDVFVDR